MRNKIYSEKNRYIRATASDYARHGMFRDELFQDHVTHLKVIYSGYYGRVIKTMHLKIRMDLKRIDGIETKASSWDAMMKAYIDKNAGQKAKETATTTLEDIRTSVQGAFANGDSEDDVIASGLSARGLSAWRAATIARTEMQAAGIYASYETASDIQDETGGSMLKTWVAIEDDRTRPDHVAIDGTSIGMTERFMVGDSIMNAPMDDSAPAEEVINCRCQLVYEMK